MKGTAERFSGRKASGGRGLPLLLRLLGQVGPFWKHLAGLLALSLLAAPISLLTPLPLKVAVDSVIDSHPAPRLLRPVLFGHPSKTAVLVGAVGLLLAVALLRQFHELVSSYLSAYTGERLVRDFRARLFARVQRLSLSYHDTRGTADSTYRIQYDAPALQYVAVEGLIPFFGAFITLAGMLYVAARIDLQLALVAIAISPLLFGVARTFRPRLRAQARRVKVLESSALGVVQEMLGALRVVKAFGGEEREQARFLRRSDEGVQARLRLALAEGIFGLLVGVITAAGTGAVLMIGIRHVEGGTLTLGNLLLVMGYVAQLYDPLKTMSRQVTSLQDSLASAERAFGLLDEAPDVPDRADARPLKRASGGVAFEAVCFAYEGRGMVLDDLSFVVPPGTRVGIMGATGAGKTTLVSLLTRFYDPTTGTILLDGTDLRDYRLGDLRRQFALVLQEPVLFATSIAENISYARPEASRDEVVEAARAAQAHAFIEALPAGYDTLVGERGMQLSGGERQRLSLARAFLKDAPVLILDEPTSSVDAGTEASILEALERLMQDRTVFIIAHRESLLKSCDLRLRLEGGRLAETLVDLSGRRRVSPGRSGRPGRPLEKSAAGIFPPPELERALHRLGLRLVHDVALKRMVHRLGCESSTGPVSVIAKRLRRRQGALNRLVLERCLPSVGMSSVAPRLLATPRESGGHAVWQLYEDVGEGALEGSRPVPERVEAVVDLIARLHATFIGHPRLGACRGLGGDLGLPFFRANLARSLLALEALRAGSIGLPGETPVVLERLLARLTALHDESEDRARLLADFGGPPTLLHGDLWTTNTFVVANAAGPEAKLIDWDHAGVGPVSYDLSTFLFRFPPGDRPWILARYRTACDALARPLPSDDLLEALLDTAERSRYANSVIWAAAAAAQGEAWAFDQLAEIDSWFDDFERGAVRGARPGDEASR